ncbi:MAG: KpsF/GutQ family sugar-phosphate isomerase [Bdellovibrionota bacterium]|nr:KpsF/GutQ family sugar-phosphate isomerase [Bdellovibrionota bacterium]
MNYVEIAKNVLSIEINSLEQMSKRITPEFNRIIEEILNAKGRFVITGMGKSGLVGRKISATLASTGTRSFFLHPGEAYHGDLGMVHSGDVVLAISNSGETEEVIKLLPFLKENGNKIIAMTGKKGSTLEKHSDYWLDIGVEKEACPLELAPTSSTTATIAMGDALSVALMEARGFKAENFAKFHPGGSLGRKLLTKVSDVMKKSELPILSNDMKFDEIISIISQGRLGLGVVLKDEKIISVITDGDIRRLLKNEKEKALQFSAGEFGSSNPLTIDANEKLVVAEAMMQEKKVTAILVTEQSKLVGIVHRYDI